MRAVPVADSAARTDRLRGFAVSVVSTFAGNPYFSFDDTGQGWTCWEDWNVKEQISEQEEHVIDYEKMFHTRYQILHMAYQRAVTNGITETDDYHSFVKKNESWLPDYALCLWL